MKTTVISVRISKKVKEELERFDVNISDVVKRSLREEIRKKKIEILKRRVKDMSHLLKKITDKEVVRLIREERER
ncbi:MAG: hypothetical protein DRO95_03390 [Candidatus Altiarchaeales archaeon]|nr:MAG: hypothetical protein DRO95_03390 [Candidatus Altiarchaeales archaeon]